MAIAAVLPVFCSVRLRLRPPRLGVGLASACSVAVERVTLVPRTYVVGFLVFLVWSTAPYFFVERQWFLQTLHYFASNS